MNGSITKFLVILFSARMNGSITPAWASTPRPRANGIAPRAPPGEKEGNNTRFNLPPETQIKDFLIYTCLYSGSWVELRSNKIHGKVGQEFYGTIVEVFLHG